MLYRENGQYKTSYAADAAIFPIRQDKIAIGLLLLFAFAGVPLFQLWTALHVPQISLPVFKGPNNMPIGAMLIAKRHDDRKLFACAQWATSKLT